MSSRPGKFDIIIVLHKVIKNENFQLEMFFVNSQSASWYVEGFSLNQSMFASMWQNFTLKRSEALLHVAKSRYEEEFEQITHLGEGAYGNVYKVITVRDK
jgi:hypothetical protein